MVARGCRARPHRRPGLATFTPNDGTPVTLATGVLSCSPVATVNPMESTWEPRELPILRIAVAHFDDPTVNRLDIADIVAATGLEETTVQSGLHALSKATPPYVEGIPVAEVPYPIILTGVTERARREVGQWPTPDAWVDRLVQALERAAAEEPDQEKRSLLMKAADLIGGVARDVAVKVASGVITGAM